MTYQPLKNQNLWWAVFITEYLTNGMNAGAAYTKAKPNVTKRTAEVESQKLLIKPEFASFFESSRITFIQSTSLTRKTWAALVYQEFLDAKLRGRDRVALQALELLGRSLGYLTDADMKVTVDFNTVYLAQHKAVKEALANKLTPEERGRRLIECEVVP